MWGPLSTAWFSSSGVGAAAAAFTPPSQLNVTADTYVSVSTAAGDPVCVLAFFKLSALWVSFHSPRRPPFAVSSSQSQVVLRLPLPGFKGLATVQMAASAPVQEFLAELHTLDASVDPSACQVRSVEGDLVGNSTLMSHLCRYPGWSLQVGDLSVVAMGGTGVQGAGELPAHLQGYQELKQSLLDTASTSMPFSDFRDTVQQRVLSAGVSASDLDQTVRLWTELLHQDVRAAVATLGGLIFASPACWLFLPPYQGVILHLSASPDAAVQDVVFLKPAALRPELHEALDLRGSNVQGEIEDHEQQLADATQLLKDMRAFEAGISSRARTRVKLVAWGAGIFMVVQWVVIFDFVYEVRVHRFSLFGCCTARHLVELGGPSSSHRAMFLCVLFSNRGTSWSPSATSSAPVTPFCFTCSLWY